MINLTDIRTRIRILLADADAERYDDDLLDEAVRWALDTFSKALPQIKEAVIDVTTAGREQSLASLTGLLNVLEADYPYQAGSECPVVLRQWYFYQRGGNAWLYLGGNRTPQTGDVFRLSYAAQHTLEGLDDATATTLPTVYETVLENGAAGKAIMMRSFQLVEAYGKKTEEPDRLKDWSERLLADFNDDLLAIKSGQSLRNALANGWVLDRWDAHR